MNNTFDVYINGLGWFFFLDVIVEFGITDFEVTEGIEGGSVSIQCVLNLQADRDTHVLVSSVDRTATSKCL